MQPGTLLANQYRVGELLGEGGMGEVYSGVAVHNGLPVALKVLLADFSSCRAFVERLRREALAMSAIDHPHVVRVYDLVVQTERPFLVMDLLKGASLGRLLQKHGTPDAATIGRIGVQVLGALEAVHGAGFIHRDVKPDNIYVLEGADGPFAKLLDFGLVKKMDNAEPELTKIHTTLGTWQYMPPEQALGLRVDGRVDLYALGASLYYALTGKRPFQGTELDAALFASSLRPARPLRQFRPDLSERFCAVIDRALRKDASLRWQTAAEMAAALEASIDTCELSIEPVLSNQPMDVTAREPCRLCYSRDVTTVVRERGSDVGAFEMVNPCIADILEGSRHVHGRKRAG